MRHFPWGLSNCWRTQPPYYPDFPSHITLFLFPLAEALGKCRLPYYVPLNTHTHIHHLLQKIKFLFFYRVFILFLKVQEFSMTLAEQ